jgi:hypothetical protein
MPNPKRDYTVAFYCPACGIESGVPAKDVCLAPGNELEIRCPLCEQLFHIATEYQEVEEEDDDGRES